MEMIPMGVADAITKEYMRGSKVFADAFNYFIYGGEQVVDPEFLHKSQYLLGFYYFLFSNMSRKGLYLKKYNPFLIIHTLSLYLLTILLIHFCVFLRWGI